LQHGPGYSTLVIQNIHIVKCEILNYLETHRINFLNGEYFGIKNM
jgi:hypothetical protein